MKVKKLHIYKLLIAYFIFSFVCSFYFFSFASSQATDASLSVSTISTPLATVGTPTNDDAAVVDVYAQGAILMDEDSGKVLYEKNANEKMFPASTTKIVTALLVLEHCEFSEMVNVSYYAIHSVPATYSIINLYPGESISIKDLLYSLMIGSANDSAFVLAEYIANGGNNYSIDASQDTKNKFDESIQKFADMMNAKAKEIGCLSTNFVNPNGIHNENHYSTAYDLALIAQTAYKNSTLMGIVKVMSFSLPNTDIYTGETRTCSSTNALLYNNKSTYYEFANGLKTGYTDAAGYCIVATASKDDVDLIAVILNGSASHGAIPDDQIDTSREGDCKRLFNYGFDNYTYTNLASSGDVASTITIINGNKDTKSLDLIVKDDIKALIMKNEVIDITPDIKVSNLLAPIAANSVVGTVTYQYNGITYVSDLIAAHDVYASDYNNFLITLFGVFATLLLIVIIKGKFSKPKKKKRKKKKH